jgi:hypothetical protein
MFVPLTIWHEAGPSYEVGIIAVLSTAFAAFFLTQSLINFAVREKIRQEFESRYGPIDERIV